MMKRFILFTILLLGTILAQADVVYITSFKGEADMIVKFTDSFSQADLIVSITDSKLTAQTYQNRWYFTDSKLDADLIIYVTDSNINSEKVYISYSSVSSTLQRE